jgi:hypothetical protein
LLLDSFDGTFDISRCHRIDNLKSYDFLSRMLFQLVVRRGWLPARFSRWAGRTPSRDRYPEPLRFALNRGTILPSFGDSASISPTGEDALFGLA